MYDNSPQSLNYASQNITVQDKKDGIPHYVSSKRIKWDNFMLL